LVGDGFDDTIITMADVNRHQLAVEVDVALAFRRIEINSLGGGDRNGIDFRLRGPFVERVLLAKIDDFFTGELIGCGIRNGGHLVLILEI
jgi:hypothetical protein